MTIAYLCQCFQFCRERPVQETLSPLSPSNMAIGKIIIMLINCDHDHYYSSTYKKQNVLLQLYTMLMIIAIQDHNDDKDEDYNDDAPTVSSPC